MADLKTIPGLSHRRARRVWLVIWASVVLAGCSPGLSAQTRQTARNVSQGPIRVQLFDVYSGLALSNANVEVTSDNAIVGVTCIRGSCPNNSQTWSGRSDDSGVLTIPRSAIQVNTYVQPKDYRLSKLAVDAIAGSSDIHPIEFYPEWLFSEQHEWIRGYKLVDARSGKVLSDTSARVEFPANDWPAQNGGITNRDVRTNALGYVFFSFLRKPEPREGQILPSAPLADWMTPEASVLVSGYRKAKLNYFEGNDAERFTTRLQRQ